MTVQVNISDEQYAEITSYIKPEYVFQFVEQALNFFIERFEEDPDVFDSKGQKNAWTNQFVRQLWSDDALTRDEEVYFREKGIIT